MMLLVSARKDACDNLSGSGYGPGGKPAKKTGERKEGFAFKMNVVTLFAQQGDIEEWMRLVGIVEDCFPGLDKKEYQKTLVQCIKKKEAICAKEQEKIVGILLFSTEENRLAFMAVHPAYRKWGIASDMIKAMISVFPTGKDIWVTTYREGDPKGEAARALYLRCGFMPDELVMEMDYPCQKFVLLR